MKVIKLGLFLILALLIFSCGGNDSGIKLSTVAYIGGASGSRIVDGTEVPADGESYIEISAKITSAAGEVWGNTPVEFTTTYGSFDEYDEEVKSITGKTDGDVAKVRLYAPRVFGKAVVEATFDDRGSEGTIVKKTVDLEFGNLVAGKKLSACHFELTCTAKNLGAYTDNNIATECFIKAQNRELNPIDVPDVKFKAEVGRMLTIPGDTPATNRYFYIADPASKPIDVDPLTASPITDCSTQCTKDSETEERCRCGLGGEILNPRDSLVTVIAYANGEECFEDTNSNGEFDPGEVVKGVFLGEPFVDSNDNGKRDDLGTYKEPYVESFGDPSAYDDEDGTWNDDITVWTQTKILLTGSPDESTTTTRFEIAATGEYINWVTGDDVGIHCNGSKIYYFYLMDEYMNPIASNEKESAMTITMSGPDIAGNYNKINAELNFNIDKYGFDMDSKGRIIKFNVTDEDLGFRYIAKVENAQGEGCTDYEGTEAYNVNISINTTPGESNSEYPFDGEKRTNIVKTWEFVGRINK